jgi:hypothetical protein
LLEVEVLQAIPRDSGFAEHVDNHEMIFVGVLASGGQLIEGGSEAQRDESPRRAPRVVSS